MPGDNKCQLTPEWNALTLVAKNQVTHNTFIFEFACPDESKPLYIPTCSCILASIDPEAPKDRRAIRAYTPVSTNALVGRFQLLIKVYPDGKLTSRLVEMNVGDRVFFKQIEFNIKIQYQPKVGFRGIKKFGMIAGGSGITPMMQVMNAVLGDKEREDAADVKITLIFGNRTEKDIIAKDILDDWVQDETVAKRLSIVHVLSTEPRKSNWAGSRGYITKYFVERYLPPRTEDCLIFVCGVSVTSFSV